MPPAPPLTPRPYILNELTWKSVRDARYEVAVLPWGATEAHNLHLPYSTDNIETERIAALAAGHAWQLGARVVVLPVVPFGVNTLQLDIPLCLNLNPSTQALLLRDLATALAGQGVRSEEHTSELQSLAYLVCRLLLEKKKKNIRRCVKDVVETSS